MSEITPKYGLKIPAAGGFTQAADIQDSFRKLDEMGQEHNADGTHKSINTPEVNTDVVRFADGSSANTGSAVAGAGTLQDVLTAGSTANIVADKIVRNAAGTQVLEHISATKGYQGMVGNINDPLVHIPFRRANDELRLSGTQTYTCATTSTYIDPLDGLLKTAAIDEPRFERMSNGKVGILLEGSSDNLRTYSNDTHNLTNATYFTSTPNNATSPDGSLTADTHTNNDTNERRGTWYQGGLLAATTYTYSLFVRAPSGAPVILFGADGADGGTTSITLNQDWQRVSFTFTTTLAQNNNIQLYIPAGVTVETWGCQVEALPFASSYIPTTSAAVNRAGNNMRIGLYGNRLPATEDMTILVDFDAPVINNANRSAHVLDFGVGENHLLMRLSSTFGNSTVFWGNGNATSAGVMLDDVVQRFGVVHNAGTFTPFVDGVLKTSKASIATTGTATSIKLGGWSVTDLYGHISNFRIYDKALTDTEMGAA